MFFNVCVACLINTAKEIKRALPMASEAIANAVDSDWYNHKQALAEHGVKLDFLCPEIF